MAAMGVKGLGGVGMRPGFIFVAALASAASLGQPAFAQQARRVSAQLTVRVTHDDNVSRSNAIVAAARGVAQKDTITSPSLSVDLLQPFGRQSLFLVGSAGYNFYEKNDQLNRERIALRGGANTSFGPCATSFTGGYSRQQTELEDITFGSVENVETIKGVFVNGACGRPIGFAPTYSFSQEWSDNSGPGRSTSDYETKSAVVGLSYRRPTFGDLSAFGNYTETLYDRAIMPASGAGVYQDGYETYGAGVRFTRRIGSRIQGSASVSYTRVDPKAPDVASFEGVTYTADLTFKPTSRINAQATFSRAVTPSSRLQTTYGVKDSFAIDASYALSSRIRFGLGATFFDNEYEYPTATAPAALLITDEQTKIYNASVRFDLNRRLAFIAEASQRERDANVHGLDFTANRIGLSVVASY